MLWQWQQPTHFNTLRWYCPLNCEGVGCPTSLHMETTGALFSGSIEADMASSSQPAFLL